MRFVKVFGLVALAAVAAMAFIGAGTASAQHSITLCKELAILCPANKLWPSLTKVLMLAEGMEIQTSIGNIKCPDSLWTAESNAAVANPYTFKNITITTGVLPTPILGTGCTGPCVEGGNERIHATMETAESTVTSVDVYSLRKTGLFLILNCPFGTCVYRGENIVAPIKHDGKHPLHPNSTNLPLSELEETLNRVTTHGGSAFCPATSQWIARFVLYLAHAPNGETGLAWPSLDKP